MSHSACARTRSTALLTRLLTHPGAMQQYGWAQGSAAIGLAAAAAHRPAWQRTSAAAAVCRRELRRQALAAGAVVQLFVNECIALQTIQLAAVGAAAHDAAAPAAVRRRRRRCRCRTAAAACGAAGRCLLRLLAQRGVAAIAVGSACRPGGRRRVWLLAARALRAVQSREAGGSEGWWQLQAALGPAPSAGGPRAGLAQPSSAEPSSAWLTAAASSSAAGTSTKGLTGKRWW